MQEYEIKNAVIENVSLDDAGRGLLTMYLQLSYGSGGQGFGGFSLYLPKNFKHHEMKSYAGHFIWRCMEIAGVTDFYALKGKTIRVKAHQAEVHSIGHIINDDWFCPKEDFEKGRDVVKDKFSPTRISATMWEQTASGFVQKGKPRGYGRITIETTNEKTIRIFSKSDSGAADLDLLPSEVHSLCVGLDNALQMIKGVKDEH